MNKTKSIVAIIMVMVIAFTGFTACKNNECTTENKCCDKCKVGEEKACCKKDSAACSVDSANCAKMDTSATKECCKKK